MFLRARTTASFAPGIRLVLNSSSKSCSVAKLRSWNTLCSINLVPPTFELSSRSSSIGSVTNRSYNETLLPSAALLTDTRLETKSG